MKRLTRLVALSAAVLGASSASAATITVTPWLAPNAFGSPSYPTWESNAVTAQRLQLPAFGTPGTPSFAVGQSNINISDLIVTNFNSWRGQANPGVAFGPAYANELGTRGHFGLRIDGQGAQFSISTLALTMSSNDPGNVLGFTFAPGYQYGSGFVGLLKGADGILFTADDVVINSGADTQLVDGLAGRGSGNAFEVLCSGCTVAQQQAAINSFLANEGPFPTQFTGTYTINVAGQNVTGSGTFNVSAAVPEPTTWMMLIAGFGLLGGALRRRRRDVAFA